jgi:hypothetical protein
MRREKIVQRRNLPAPWQFQAYLQPLGVLTEHRVDDANEGFITVEEAAPSGQKIYFQPTLTLFSMSIESSTQPTGARNLSFFASWANAIRQFCYRAL